MWQTDNTLSSHVQRYLGAVARTTCQTVLGLLLAVSIVTDAWTQSAEDPDDNHASATATRASLIEAWEQRLRQQSKLTRLADNEYRLVDTSLPYDGRVTLIGAVVRTMPQTEHSDEYAQVGVSYTGFVDFRLNQLSEELRNSQIYYYWASELQNYYFYSGQNQADETENPNGRWISANEWSELRVPDSHRRSLLSILFDDVSLWLLLAALIALLLIIRPVLKQQAKARSLIDDSFAINQLARNNLERTEKLHQQTVSFQEQMLEIARSNQQLLEQILQQLRK